MVGILYKSLESESMCANFIYKIVNIYDEEKTGRVRILRDKEKTTLTLITCTKDDKYHQTVYIAELIGIE